MKLIQDLFYGKNNAISQGMRIYQGNQTLIDSLVKNQEYKEALESALPTFSYQDIINTLKAKYPDLKLDPKKEFDTVKDLIPMFRDQKFGSQNVNFSKLTPLMIKQRIRENFINMDLEEFQGLQKLLNMDSKLRHLQMSQSNYEFYKSKNKKRDQQETDHQERHVIHKKRLNIIKKNKISELFKTETQQEKQDQILKIGFINTARAGNNYGNNITEYAKLFMEKNQDKWERVQQHKKRQSDLIEKEKLLNLKQIKSKSSTPLMTNTLWNANIQGSILQLFPKYGLILNKPKLPFYQVNKFSKNVKPEQLETHETLVYVNKFNIKKGLRMKELAENDDPNQFYRNYSKTLEKQKKSSNNLEQVGRRTLSQKKDSLKSRIADNDKNQINSNFFDELTKNRFVGSRYQIIPKRLESRPPTACQRQFQILNQDQLGNCRGENQFKVHSSEKVKNTGERLGFKSAREISSHRLMGILNNSPLKGNDLNTNEQFQDSNYNSIQAINRLLNLMGGSQSAEAGRSLVDKSTGQISESNNKQIAIIALSTFAVTSLALYVVHSMDGNKKDQNQQKKKNKHKKNLSHANNPSRYESNRRNNQQLKQGDYQPHTIQQNQNELQYLQQNPHQSNYSNFQPQNINDRSNRKNSNIQRSQYGGSVQNPQYQQREGALNASRYTQQSYQTANPNMVRSDMQNSQRNLNQYDRSGKYTAQDERTERDSHVIRGARRESQINKAQSVQQLAFDNLSVATSTNYIEDSDEDGDFIEYEIKHRCDEDGILSYQTIVQIFDKRQVIKGIKKMKHDFKVKRRKLLIEQNIVSYKKVVLLYKKAIESKLEDNLKFIANKLKLKLDDIEAAQEKHFLNADLTFVLGIKDFLKHQPPKWLVGQRAIEIYQEIKEYTQSLAQSEFQFDGRKVDLYGDDDEGDVLKYKALDHICLKYQIEEEQLKHVLYINFILPNQEETPGAPVGSIGQQQYDREEGQQYQNRQSQQSKSSHRYEQYQPDQQQYQSNRKVSTRGSNKQQYR
eukprot:403367560